MNNILVNIMKILKFVLHVIDVPKNELVEFAGIAGNSK